MSASQLPKSNGLRTYPYIQDAAPIPCADARNGAADTGASKLLVA
jgi:hypothetical protein